MSTIKIEDERRLLRDREKSPYSLSDQLETLITLFLVQDNNPSNKGEIRAAQAENHFVFDNHNGDSLLP